MPGGTRRPLPELFCPIEPRISPLRAELDTDVARWMEVSRLYEHPAQLKRYVRSSFGSFAARVCPDAEREELLLFSRWLAFGFFYDDTLFDEGHHHEHPYPAADAVMAIVSVLSAEGEPSDLPRPYDPDGSHRLDTAADLVLRTRSIATPEQFDRFRTQMILWFYSYLYEPLTRQRGNGPTLPGYRVNRLHNIASLPYVTGAPSHVAGSPLDDVSRVSNALYEVVDGLARRVLDAVSSGQSNAEARDAWAALLLIAQNWRGSPDLPADLKTVVDEALPL
ncbi:terpene synthase family protein [Streptomyces yaizuensis]|uniref:Terpene synthase n=1 Tax=Streptomyces yaizuensis TaxID=2989713 RepID=A0ABQ5NXQ3_9ACTN|nr:hypothetical protein [Streptomyces sp. YSPA8]GLF95143.1 hypothetical protein SYYSPA8_12620 [Streptomyces sp. YSPA8]